MRKLRRRALLAVAPGWGLGYRVCTSGMRVCWGQRSERRETLQGGLGTFGVRLRHCRALQELWGTIMSNRVHMISEPKFSALQDSESVYETRTTTRAAAAETTRIAARATNDYILNHSKQQRESRQQRRQHQHPQTSCQCCRGRGSSWRLRTVLEPPSFSRGSSHKRREHTHGGR